MTATNILDSRDLQERIDELEGEAERDEDEQKELGNLLALKEEVGDYGEWESGIAFIADDYFEDYARDFAEDIGAIGKDTQWPATHIDWESAALELQMDFSSVEFDGTTYHYR